jgi:hypothetical protein
MPWLFDRMVGYHMIGTLLSWLISKADRNIEAWPGNSPEDLEGLEDLA